MTVQEFVNNVLCVPVTKRGNQLIVEAIEIVNDQHTHRFYPQLSEITGEDTRKLEEPIRSAKVNGWANMSAENKRNVFSAASKIPSNTTYIVYAAYAYKKKYKGGASVEN